MANSVEYTTFLECKFDLYLTGQVQQTVQMSSGAQAVGTPPRLSTPIPAQTPQTASSPRPQQGQVKLTLAQLTQLTQGAQVCFSFKSACFYVITVPNLTAHASMLVN